MMITWSNDILTQRYLKDISPAVSLYIDATASFYVQLINKYIYISVTPPHTFQLCAYFALYITAVLHCGDAHFWIRNASILSTNEFTTENLLVK